MDTCDVETSRKIGAELHVRCVILATNMRVTWEGYVSTIIDYFDDKYRANNIDLIKAFCC
jgi:hypothetical protein